MRSLPALLLVAVALAGCGGASPAASRAGPAPDGGVERGALALVVRGDTTVLDEYSRTETVLQGVVRPRASGAKFGWARYRVEFAPTGEATVAHLALGRVGTSPESAPVDSLTTVLGPSRIREEWPNRGPTETPAAPGTVPIFAPSIAMFQEIVRRAHRVSGGTGEVEVPVYPLLNRGGLERVRVRWTAPDTVEVRWDGGPTARYAVGPDGEILWGRTSDGEFTTVRLHPPRG